ncbi:MAG: ATP-binding protein [Chloroflexota bacterium]
MSEQRDGVEESPLAQLAVEAREEYELTQKALKELDVSTKQISGEVDRLAQRNVQIANRLRQVEVNIDTVPRSDIQEVYAASQDAQKRLFMMKGQLEKLQSDQKNLEKHGNWLRRIMEVTSAFRQDEVEGPPETLPATSQATIVRIIEAQENERMHLARKMHDGPAQSLTNLILQAEICERLFDSDPQQARAELARLKEAVNSTFQKTYNFIFDLRPMMLDDLGLVPTLKRYVNGFQEKNNLQTDLSVMGKERRLPSHTEVTVFRVVQALMDNARQHAHPTRIQVMLDVEGATVTASVEDDGTGFDVAEVMAAASQQRGLGIAAMKERVEMLGGTLDFDSVSGRGTKVTLRLPAN